MSSGFEKLWGQVKPSFVILQIKMDGTEKKL